MSEITRGKAMKNHSFLIFVVLISLIVPGCFHQTDDEVISDACAVSNDINSRYREILNAPDDESILEFAYHYGSSNRVGGFAGMWNDYVGKDYLTKAGGAPLHRAAYFIEGDTYEINRHLGYLESRMLSSLTLHQKLRTLSKNLNYALHVIKVSPVFAEESRYIEKRKLQQQQLEESRKQNQLLNEIAEKRPVIIHEEKIVEKPIIVCEAKRGPKPHLQCQKVDGVLIKKCPKKKKKQKKETVITVDDIHGKRPHLVI
jgi:hypothetical protein